WAARRRKQQYRGSITGATAESFLALAIEQKRSASLRFLEPSTLSYLKQTSRCGNGREDSPRRHRGHEEDHCCLREQGVPFRSLLSPGFYLHQFSVNFLLQPRTLLFSSKDLKRT